MESLLISLGLIFSFGFLVPIIIKLFYYVKKHLKKHSKKESVGKSDSLFNVDYDINIASYVSKKKGQSNCEINDSEDSLLTIMNDFVKSNESVKSINSKGSSSQIPENKIFSFV